jgi:hypothetical protein
MPNSTKYILTLEASGTNGCEPDKNPWYVCPGKAVEIVNNSGHEQTLSNISNGLISPSPQGRIVVPTSGWTGRIGNGNTEGTYQYEDGLPVAGPRTGIIDPS